MPARVAASIKAFRRAPWLPTVRCAGPEKSSLHELLRPIDFGVDAVLPADLGGAPRAHRQHTKGRAVDASVADSRRLRGVVVDARTERLGRTRAPATILRVGDDHLGVRM